MYLYLVFIELAAEGVPQFKVDEAVKSAKARHSGEGRSPEVSEITGSRLQFIPHFVRGRDDKIGKNSTFYEFINYGR